MPLVPLISFDGEDFGFDTGRVEEDVEAVDGKTLQTVEELDAKGDGKLNGVESRRCEKGEGARGYKGGGDGGELINQFSFSI